MRTFIIALTHFVICSLSFGQDNVQGATVFNLNCARCHQARPAHEFSDREWDVIVPHMREKAHLDAEEAANVLGFLRNTNLPENAQYGVIPSRKAADGAELVERFACIGCHTIDGNGGVLGPSLDDISAKRSRDFLQQKMENPQFNNPASPMPQFPLSAGEIEAIIDYLSQSRKQAED